MSDTDQKIAGLEQRIERLERIVLAAAEPEEEVVIDGRVVDYTFKQAIGTVHRFKDGGVDIIDAAGVTHKFEDQASASDYMRQVSAKLKSPTTAG